MSVLPSDVAFYSALLDPAFDGAATLSAAVTTTTAATVAINAPASPSAAFPAVVEVAIQIDSEVLWVTQATWSGTPGNSTATLTVIRGFMGTTAATHLISAAVTGKIDVRNWR